ncbi:hypothetical protein AB2L27_14970 [Kineococcus sp. LSe6-4]|uniref:NERD domain-containing protein n=1 Tax=Kineococcus halophytocola TaxID=3234027 RepID=A0ABV4H429_9ACTN
MSGVSEPGGAEFDVDGTLFRFPTDWIVSIFDEWPVYHEAAGALGVQGCDVVALDHDTLWLIEMKDYTYPGAVPPPDLVRTVGQKAVGTMALLFALQRATADSPATEFARRCAGARRVRLALHVEIPDGGRGEKQVRAVLVPLQQQLRRATRSLRLDRPVVTGTLLVGGVEWTARRDPTTRSRHRDR